MFEKFTQKAIDVVQSAQNYALQFCHEKVLSQHILLGLVFQTKGVQAKILNFDKINFGELTLEIHSSAPINPNKCLKMKAAICQRGCPAPSRDTWAAEGAVVSFALVSCAYRHQGEGGLRGTHLEQNAGVAFRHRGRPNACRGLCLVSRRCRLPLLGRRGLQYRPTLHLA